ncbi:hypothetical protein N9985_01010 [Gammaproteobacteria bacterium]|nr:hypothetical protein [Gammaproteobacteria bacterium]
MSDPDATNCFYLDIDERAVRLLQYLKADIVMDLPVSPCIGNCIFARLSLVGISA